MALRSSPAREQLSAREREVVSLVAAGLTDQAIADTLFISIRTVRSHLDRIRDKTGCRRRSELTRLALDLTGTGTAGDLESTGGTLPIRSPEPARDNLPVQLSSFLGRRLELDLGTKLLASSRLLTVTGPGGTGKTRLAYQLAANEMQKFPDGVWVAELAPVLAPERVANALMAAVGLRDERGRDTTETVVAHFRSREALVVLDNCEHIIAAAAALAAELLKGCGGLRVLATSREPLRIAGESVWQLPPLALPDDGLTSLAEMAQADAIALFCERAGEAKVGFGLDNENAGPVKAICSRLDGVPLAIELAAARVRTLPLEAIADRLNRSLHLLSKGARDAADRQASLRGAVAWSHDLLNDDERVLFRRLSVFAGGFSLEAAESVCAGEMLRPQDVVDTLDGLVDKSLVTLGDRRAGEHRYRLLEIIRAFAAEQLEDAGEESGLAMRHASYYASLADECAREGDSAAGALGRLEVDHPNLLAAVGYLAGTDRQMDHGRLLVDLAVFWDLRGHWRLGRQELLRYLARDDADRPLAGQCRHGLGTVHYNLGELKEAQLCYEAGLAIALEVGDSSLQGRCLRGLARLAAGRGDHVRAQHLVERAAGIARQSGDRRLEGRCCGDLGIIATTAGDYSGAEPLFAAGVEIAREVGDRRFEGYWVGDLGDVFLCLGDYPEAEDHFTEALLIAQEVSDRRMEGFWLGNLGEVAVRRGELDEARRYYSAARNIARQLGDTRNEGLWLGALGDVAANVGDYDEAKTLYEQAAGIARNVGDLAVEGLWIGDLGVVAARLGDYREAEALLKEALDIASRFGDRRFDSLWVAALAEIAATLGNFDEARTRFEEALGVAAELGRKNSPLLDSCASLLVRMEHFEDAAVLLAAADNLNARGHKKRADWEQARYDATLSACRDNLGQETLEKASSRGRTLNWASAVDTALAAVR